MQYVHRLQYVRIMIIVRGIKHNHFDQIWSSGMDNGETWPLSLQWSTTELWWVTFTVSGYYDQFIAKYLNYNYPILSHIVTF